MMYFVVATRSTYGFPVEIIYFLDEARKRGLNFSRIKKSQIPMYLNPGGDAFIKGTLHEKWILMNLIDLGTFQNYPVTSYLSFLAMWIDLYESIQLKPQDPSSSICV